MKDLQKYHHKFLDKLPLTVGDEPEVRVNRYSGARCLLEPLAVALFDFIFEAEGEGERDAYGQYKTVLYKGHHVATRDWHAARFLFRDLWPDEYMDLID